MKPCHKIDLENHLPQKKKPTLNQYMNNIIGIDRRVGFLSHQTPSICAAIVLAAILSVAATTNAASNEVTVKTRVITGHVIDAETKQPIPSFTIKRGYSGAHDFLNLDLKNVVIGTNGNYQLLASGISLLVESPGYAPELAFVRTNTTLHFQLRKGTSVGGVVLNPNGQPVSSAQVMFRLPFSYPRLDATKLNDPFARWSTSMHRSPESITDVDGKFNLPATGGAKSFLAVHETGFTDQSFTTLPLGSNTVVRLQPWSRVEGNLKQGGQPRANREIILDTYLGIISHGYNLSKAIVTDQAGHFVFDQIPAGEFRVFYSGTKGLMPAQIVKTEAGRTATLELNIPNEDSKTDEPSPAGKQ